MLRVSRRAAIAAISGIIVSTATPAFADTTVKTVSVPVEARGQVTTAEKYPVNKVGWPCPVESGGTAPEPPPTGFLRVGWSHYFDKGTLPFQCQYRLNHVERVIIAPPNLSEIKSRMPKVFVRAATLSFDKRRGTGDYDCNDKIYAVVPGEASIPPRVEELYDLVVPKLGSAGCVGSRCSVDMRGQVEAWVRGNAQELGLVIIGDQERLDANDNVKCTTDYGNFKLDVTFAFDGPAGGGLIVPILKPGILNKIIHLDVAFVRKTASELLYDLTWNVTDGNAMEIIRDGAKVQDVADKGNQRDRAPFGPHVYKICDSKTKACSNEVSVSN